MYKTPAAECFCQLRLWCKTLSTCLQTYITSNAFTQGVLRPTPAHTCLQTWKALNGLTQGVQHSTPAHTCLQTHVACNALPLGGQHSTAADNHGMLQVATTRPDLAAVLKQSMALHSSSQEISVFVAGETCVCWPTDTHVHCSDIVTCTGSEASMCSFQGCRTVMQLCRVDHGFHRDFILCCSWFFPLVCLG